MPNSPRPNAKLSVEGEVARPIELDSAAISALPNQIEDVAALVKRRVGKAVRLSAILDTAGVTADATHLTVISEQGDFSASVPLDGVREAVVVYELDGAALPAAKGGPFRFLIPEAAPCHSAEIDTCANVKFVGRLILTKGEGEDTRPSSPRGHHALHKRPGHEHLE